VLFKTGQRVLKKGQWLFIFKANSLAINRYGFVIPKKSAKLSTVRNRTKRLLREACRLNKQNITQGFDMILFAYKPLESFKQAEELFFEALAKAKMLKNRQIDVKSSIY